MNQDQFWVACYKTITLIHLAHPERVEPRRDLQDPCRAEHLVWMLEMAVVHYSDGKPEKANRWLGYTQGVIAARGWATLDELKRANMPEGEQFDGDRV
jgi:hypothetical protein